MGGETNWVWSGNGHMRGGSLEIHVPPQGEGQNELG